jgi:SAM-dependent methyltransferase
MAAFDAIKSRWLSRDKVVAPEPKLAAAPGIADAALDADVLADEAGDLTNEPALHRHAKSWDERALPAPRLATAAEVRFSEKNLRAEILDLVSSRSTAKAGRALIENLRLMAEARFNIKEKLSNLLFLSRIVQDGGGAKYGHAKLRSKIRSVTGFLRQHDLPKGGFVELGCGAHDPIAMSTFFYLNGFEPSCGVDLLPPRVEHYSAMSMYDILANMKLFPERYVWRGGDPKALAARIDTIDVAKFESGDFWGGLDSMAGKVRLIDEDLLICDLQPGSIALLTSFAVLEHVTDIAGIFARCFDLLAPGGIAYHFIDLADHRSYRGDDTFTAFSFLTEDDAPPNMNRVRAPQFAEAALAAGFELLMDRRIVAEMSRAEAENLVAPFATMARDDVATTKQHLVLRKPV